MVESPEATLEAFQKLGDSVILEPCTMSGIESYICKLFGATETNVDDARVQLFKRGKFSEELLPPTRKSLENHTRRANYQAMVWKRALDCTMDIPSPSDHGWKIDGSSISIDWGIDGSSEIADLSTCSCKGGCKTRACKCMKNDLKCADACKCSNCENVDISKKTKRGNEENSSDDEDEYYDFEDFEEDEIDFEDDLYEDGNIVDFALV